MKLNIKEMTKKHLKAIIITGAVAVVGVSACIGVYAVNTNVSKTAAKSIALAHAGVTESEVSKITSQKDFDNGIFEYEIEFWIGNSEYDYEINAKTGEIISYDWDIEKTVTNNTSTEKSSTNSDSSTVLDSYIGEENAQTIALDHAGVTELEVNKITSKIDLDNDVYEYDVEFWVDNTEYDYEINAITGEIISYDWDINQTESVVISDTSESFIGETEAQLIALNHAEFTETEITAITSKIDLEKGVYEYDVEFWVDNAEYDYEINAVTGEIISYDWDTEKTVTDSTSETIYISESEAKSIALTHADVLESDTTFLRIEFDIDKGIAEYEVEWNIGSMEYEYAINAVTGAIIEFDVEIDK